MTGSACGRAWWSGRRPGWAGFQPQLPPVSEPEMSCNPPILGVSVFAYERERLVRRMGAPRPTGLRAVRPARSGPQQQCVAAVPADLSGLMAATTRSASSREVPFLAGEPVCIAASGIRCGGLGRRLDRRRRYDRRHCRHGASHPRAGRIRLRLGPYRRRHSAGLTDLPVQAACAGQASGLDAKGATAREHGPAARPVRAASAAPSPPPDSVLISTGPRRPRREGSGLVDRDRSDMALSLGLSARRVVRWPIRGNRSAATPGRPVDDALHGVVDRCVQATEPGAR
jgi:hypothetical protein